MTSTLAFSDQFYRANTTPGTAGSSTGGGANWTDVHGSVASILDNKLALTDDGIDGNTFNRDSVLLPSSLNSLDQKIIFYFDLATPYGSYTGSVVWSVQLGYSSLGTAELFQIIWTVGTNAVQGAIYNQSAGSVANRGLTQSFTADVTHKYMGVATLAPPSGGSRLASLTIYDLTAGGSKSVSFAETAAPIQSATGYAVVASTSVNGGKVTTYFDRIDVIANPSAVSGSITQTANGPTGLTLAATASGGTGTGYSFQWHKSTTAGFTPSGGTAISGATNATLTDTAPTGLTYYVCVVTDSASASNATPQFVASSYAAPLNLLFIGTSVTAYTPPDGTISPPMAAARAIAAVTGLRTLNVVNSAVAGSASGQWTGGSANLNAAISAGHAAACTAAYIEMGPNDAAQGVTASAFGSNMTSMLTALTAAGITPILGYPNYAQPYAVPFNNPAAQYPANVASVLATYLPVIDTKINGTTVLRGATANFTYSGEHLEETLDGIHPNDRGVTSYGSFVGMAIAKALQLLPSTAATSGGSLHLSIGGGVSL